jgi:hypothetical protein
MADKYIIRIQPNMSPEDAKKLEDDLNKRFNRVAKKAGSNLQNSFKNAAKTAGKYLLGGIGIGSIASILTNPFDKVNEDLNQTLDRFDNSAQKSEQFGVNSAKYFRAERIAESFGVEDFETIINRFSGSLEAARTGEDKTLKNFTQDKDVIDAFTAFTESLSSMTANNRNAALDRVFGGRMGLRVGDLAAQSDENIKDRNRRIFGDKTDEQIATELKKMENLKDLQDIQDQRRIVRELELKSAAINRGTLEAQDSQARAKLNTETQQLSQYQIYAQQTILQERMATTLDQIRSDVVSTLLPALQKIVDFIAKVPEWINNIIAAIKKINPFSK